MDFECCELYSSMHIRVIIVRRIRYARFISCGGVRKVCIAFGNLRRNVSIYETITSSGVGGSGLDSSGPGRR
jgi:hypothetical protein